MPHDDDYIDHTPELPVVPVPAADRVSRAGGGPARCGEGPSNGPVICGPPGPSCKCRQH
jgi:hypothetical protein